MQEIELVVAADTPTEHSPLATPTINTEVAHLERIKQGLEGVNRPLKNLNSIVVSRLQRFRGFLQNFRVMEVPNKSPEVVIALSDLCIPPHSSKLLKSLDHPCWEYWQSSIYCLWSSSHPRVHLCVNPFLLAIACLAKLNHTSRDRF